MVEFALVLPLFMLFTLIAVDFGRVYFSYVHPNQVFGFDLSIGMVLMGVIGGVGTVWGPVLGAAIYLGACIVLGAKFVRMRGWRAYGVYSLIFGLISLIYPIGIVAYLINPTAFGNVNSPNDGVINRIVLLLGPIAWYVITATLTLLRADRTQD